MRTKLRKLVLSIALFSRLVVQIPLRKYQIAPADAVVDSILGESEEELQ